jgi:hypothetical protein
MLTLSTSTKRFIIDSKDCEYCNEWKAYGSEEDNAMLDKIGVPPGSGWNAKECHRLLKLLYLDEISIEEFKKMFTDAGMDYNKVEHCCGCAGCYKRKSHTCPDFDIEDLVDRPDCKIFDPIYFCDICGKPAKYGDISTPDEIVTGILNEAKKGKSYDWLCKKHFNRREKQLFELKTSDDDALAKHIGV